MKRTFIAIKISLSKETEKLFNEIKSKLNESKINWVDTHNMHITLFFLGDTKESQIPEICSQIERIARETNPFLFTCKGLGLFKNIHDPRVIWLGIKKSDSLNGLKQNIDFVMQDMGFEIEPPDFKPHITLGRIKFIKNKMLLAELVEKYRDYAFQDIPVNEVIFYESILTSQGPIYKEIQVYKLSTVKNS
ncbi:MAG: 2'-5' RNA ligase [Bacteroidetes bacterium GWC2_33_15]|nr:MAG: 2'-5' RNA ligase [Bacteroidetes bacterium GWA2_33_15]OFX50065.1 MAG: 2'-5' RNA ligase [Bacteroidetes bacterium GWC2_33_15]OFX65218.1 MAG: 2'-5' RNA ligase [Bacteroidetes bacterium GWB2_32_14]OFX70444.1 MAG: 2'-5' RNA ligase [Bacteroidetes bacterium GWD2_33_33]HAN19685.1 RNA 2',3'-cyclic phosphodiesterase [Bacteroidales bacterium]